jgi:NAD-dependent dihydropyrimidine dehydrogenase PreA subunit
MPKRIAVVLSQGQSQHPAKRDLEETIVTALLMEHGLDVTVIPHLYDLQADGTGILALQGISGDMIVLSWLFERAARWTLDRHDIRGQEGVTLLKSAAEDDEDEEEEPVAEEEPKERVIDSRPLPSRKIYCLDLRIHDKAQPYIDEIKRIYNELNTKVVELSGWLNGKPSAEQLARYANPTNGTALGPVADAASIEPDAGSVGNGVDAAANLVRIAEEPARRWYPVIDFSRCTNCMECIDFCLFGVYGVDGAETILVEQPDNCRKGCPACSRVCPENAIIFPQHKTPAIAGSPEVSAGLKIDLSQLFGAPAEGASAVEVAARERDEQLVLAGREAVGMSAGIPKRQEGKAAGPKDDLDDLLDELDELDL